MVGKTKDLNTGNLLVNLRLINEGHIEDICLCLNNKKLAKFYNISLPYTMEKAQQYFESEKTGRKEGKRYAFAIELNHQFAGICALYNVDKFNYQAKIYYWVAVKYWNNGIGSEAVRKLNNYAKRQLHLTQLKTGVLQRNYASLRVLEKNGFSVEKSLINEGKYHDKFLGETFLEMKLNL